MGLGDTAIFYMLIITFLLLGTMLPFIEGEFLISSTDYDTQSISDTIQNEGSGITGVTSIGIAKIVFSIVGMFTWTFGGLPPVVELIFFLPLRILFYFLLFRQVRGVGG